MSKISNKTKGCSDRSDKFRDRVVQNQDTFQNAILAVLASAGAKEVIRIKSQVGRGKVYWVHYTTNKGKRRATFISPKEFKGYRWFDDFSTVVNLESGAVYEVSESYCSCPSWKYQVKAGKKEQCKHQAMRSEHVGVNLSSLLPSSEETNSDRTLYDRFVLKSNPYKVNPNVLDRGLSLERSDDYTCTEYYLKAWQIDRVRSQESGVRSSNAKAKSSIDIDEINNKSNSVIRAGENNSQTKKLLTHDFKLLTPNPLPVQKRIGRIIETDDGFMVAGMRGMARAVYKLQRDAINWILNYNGISIESIKAAYIEQGGRGQGAGRLHPTTSPESLDLLQTNNLKNSPPLPAPCSSACHKCGNELKYVGWITEPDNCPQCGWVEKKLTEREQRRLAREEKAEKPSVVLGFGGFF